MREDGANDPLEGVDWGAVFQDVVNVFAAFMSSADAQDAASAGIELVFGGQAPWDPNGKLTLVRHVVAVGYNLRRNEQKKRHKRKRSAFVTGVVESLENEKPANPEDAYADEEERAQRRERLFAACAGDAEATLVLEAEDNGVHGVEAQMEYCKLTRQAVRNARGRIGRRLPGVLEEQEDEAAS